MGIVNNLGVNAPNVIVPLQHQSAPKVTAAPAVHTASKSGPQQQYAPDIHGNMIPVARPVTGDYDSEMDLPIYHDPQMQKAVAQLEERVLDVSPSETVESALREFEKNRLASKAQRWAGQERWEGKENEEMRLVRIMHPNSFIDQLARIGIAARKYTPNGWQPQRDRIWLNDFSRVGRIGVNAWVPNHELQKLEPRTLTTLQYPYGPEYTLMRFNEYGIMTGQKYQGWRTALLTLIVYNVLTEQEADAAFGAPTSGPASLFYRQQLYEHRNGRLP